MQSKFVIAWCSTLLVACSAAVDSRSGSGSGSGSGAGSGSGSGAGSGSDITAGFTLDATGFVVVGSQWWTSSSSPTLRGSISDTSGTLQAYVGGVAVGSPATYSGTAWKLALPPGTVTSSGTTLQLQLSGNGVTPSKLDQLLVLDTGAPSIQLYGSVLDERNDTIDFSSGGPIHAHHGTPVELGSGCPDVYLYAYLMDSVAPAWGGETSANPLAWQVSATSPVGIDTSASQYRVRGGDGTVLVDWTPLADTGDHPASIALHRDGAQAIRALGTDVVQAYVDVQMADALGNAATATSCATYHPLAAPVLIQPIVPESTGEALFGMTFAAASPISDVLQSAAHVPSVFRQQFAQYTAEPITLALAFVPPTAQYAKTVSTVYVPQSIGALSCGSSEVPSSDPRCSTLTNTTAASSSSSGAVATAVWTLAVIDEQSGLVATECTVSQLTATCSLPPRAPGAAPHTYRLVAMLADVTDLAPGSGTLGEYTVNGATYTGIAPITVQKCTSRTTTFSGSTAYYTCEYTTYAKVIALSAAQLAFAPVDVGFSASVGADVSLAPVPYAPSPVTSIAMMWDAGAASLP